MSYPYVNGMTVRDLILRAGGLRTGAYLGMVDIARVAIGQVRGDTITHTFTVALDSAMVFDAPPRIADETADARGERLRAVQPGRDLRASGARIRAAAEGGGHGRGTVPGTVLASAPDRATHRPDRAGGRPHARGVRGRPAVVASRGAARRRRPDGGGDRGPGIRRHGDCRHRAGGRGR